MVWLLLAVLIILLAFAIPRLGRVVAIVFAVVVAILAAIIFTQERERSEELKRITVDEVSLEEMVMTMSRQNRPQLLGRVRNQSSQYAIKQVAIEISLEECKAQACDVLGQQIFEFNLNIPPLQVREVDEFLVFRVPQRNLGELKWQFKPVSVRAN